MSVRKVLLNGTREGWVARVTYKGRRRAKVCRSRDHARDVEAELRQALKAEVAADAERDARPATVRQMLAYYVDGLTVRGKSADSVARAAETVRVIDRAMPALMDRQVSKITDADIYAFRRARVAAGIKPSTINRDFRTIRAAIKQAIPAYRFPAGAFLPEDDTRVRWLGPDQEVLLDAALRPPFREIAAVARLTLMRLSEVRTLRREYVHLDQGVVMLPRAKGGARPVILNDAAQRILRVQLAAHDGAVVFPGPKGQPFERNYVGRVFRRAARTAGLRDFTFHDNRHHGATMALNAGFTAPIVMALGGWKTPRMMLRYAAVTDATLRRAAEAVSGAVPGRAAPTGSPVDAGGRR